MNIKEVTPEEFFVELQARALRMTDLATAVEQIKMTESEHNAMLVGIAAGISATMGELQENNVLRDPREF